MKQFPVKGYGVCICTGAVLHGNCGYCVNFTIIHPLTTPFLTSPSPRLSLSSRKLEGAAGRFENLSANEDGEGRPNQTLAITSSPLSFSITRSFLPPQSLWFPRKIREVRLSLRVNILSWQSTSLQRRKSCLIKARFLFLFAFLIFFVAVVFFAVCLFIYLFVNYVDAQFWFKRVSGSFAVTNGNRT